MNEQQITETERWKYWEDEITKKGYYAMHPIYRHVTPKERKANQVKWTYKYGDKEIKHLTSKQLGAMLIKKSF